MTMSAAIEIPTIRRNGSEDDNDSFLPDDEKEDYSPLVSGNGEPNKNYERDEIDSTSNKILSLLTEYKQKIVIATCIVFVVICASYLMPKTGSGKFFCYCCGSLA
jgi:hypothetical protein